MKTRSYTNFIILGFILSGIYALCFLLMRLRLAFETFENFSLQSAFSEEFAKMFQMGFILDMRAICIVFAVFIAFAFLTKINQILLKNRYGGGAFDKFIYTLTLCFSTIASFLIIISVFVNFYYFQTYHTKIDIFIFGLKDDDTAAILKIIWADYPAIAIFLASLIFSILCFKLSTLILNRKNSWKFKSKLSIFAAVLLNLILILLVFVGIRGSVGTFPLREDAHHICANPLINHIATNPLIALGWAYSHYQRQDSFQAINLSELKDLESELFPIFKTNSQKHISKNPNVVVVLMESFGSNILALDDEKNFDLLMSFRKDFEKGKERHQNQTDFTFMNFLSGQNGTAGSFASLFFLSPNANISLSSVKNKKLSHTPFDVYKKAGYEVIYITSGNRSWQNFGDYITTLGANAVYDSNFLLKHYPQSKDTQNAYGVLDEFAYKTALEILQRATKPTFIVILTTSNHPPYASLPQDFKLPHYDLKSKMAFFRQSEEIKIQKSLQIFSYASNAFGEFIQNIKNSALKDSTIIAMSGDHIYRDLKAYANVALNHAVPLFLYIPNAYTKDFKSLNWLFNPQTLGSHKDIFPTLYALSLNECEFLTLGGRNLFNQNADKAYQFAYNSSVFIDKEGIYPRGANSAFAFKEGFFIQDEKQTKIELAPQKAEFFEKYDRLNNLQLNFRLFGEE